MVTVGAGGIRELTVLSSQIPCEPKATLKNKVKKGGRKVGMEGNEGKEEQEGRQASRKKQKRQREEEMRDQEWPAPDHILSAPRSIQPETRPGCRCF